MISALVDRANKRTVTLTPLNADGLAAWRTTATPAARAWLAGHAFTAASGAHLIVPGADGAPAEVLVGLDGAEVGLWDLADLPGKLPAGRYRLAGAPAPAAAPAAALGWLLGGDSLGRDKTDRSAKSKKRVELV
ncbi:MAG: leucyl aminopeptidase family protein, partial [Pseudomonadota bacterium]|nr:leucyl aminopeptidase family protein [Pseudomonadota bacterium]